MSTILVGPEVEAPPDVDSGGSGFDGIGPEDDGDRGGGPERQHDRYQTGIWVLMIPIVMLFLGLTSSLVVRRGSSDDWAPFELPGILWLNTMVLLASSVALEGARRTMNVGLSDRFRAWLYLTAGLGTFFLFGQLIAWRQLAAQGVFLASNPSSSFFYVLTATHGAHLLGGMTALIYLTIRALRNEFDKRRQSAFKATTVYWHFMDALWIYLLLLLTPWR